MAYRKRTGFKRKSRRRFIRKARRRTRRKITQTGYFKLREVLNLTTGSSATLIGDNPEGSTDWPALQLLYEFYRTYAVKIKIIPSASSIEMGTTQSFRPLYILHDWNLTPATASAYTENVMLQHDSTRVFRTDRVINFFARMKNSIGASGLSGSKLWQGTLNAADTQRVVIKGDNTTALVGRLIVTRYVQFKFRV